jgi:hypothetical protein
LGLHLDWLAQLPYTHNSLRIAQHEYIVKRIAVKRDDVRAGALLFVTLLPHIRR